MSDLNTPKYINGTIADICQNLYEELVTTGYSLLYTDVENIIFTELKDYLAWNGEIKSLQDVASDSLMHLDISPDTELTIEEWTIIKPCVMAHCEIMQAKRMEGVQNLGVQPVGVSSSEAKQVYHEARLQMQKEAFDCEPFSVENTSIDKRSVTTTKITNKFWWW